MTRKPNKAALVKELREKGIPVPDKPTVENLTARLNWLGGKGWILRRFKPHPDPNHPVNKLEHGVLTYVPNSIFAEKIVMSKKAMVVARAPMPWDGVPILEPTPEDEEE